MKYNAMKIEYTQTRLNEVFLFYLKLFMDLIGIDVTESISKYEDDDRLLITFAKNTESFKSGVNFAIRVNDNQKDNLELVLKLIGLTDELKNILDLFFEKKYYSIVFFMKYFYPLPEKESRIIIKNAYEFIGSLVDFLETEDVKWEEEKNKITKFALLRVFYDVNLFKKKDHFIDSFDDLIKKELSVKKYFEKEYPAIYYLIAESYVANNDYNKAYEFFIQYEIVGFGKSALLARKKGNYWFDFAGDNERAVMYYERAAKLSKTDYFIYMKLGLSYFEIRSFYDAVGVFNIAKKILAKRLALGVLLPREFYNCMFINLKLSEIYIELNRYGDALTQMYDIIFLFENLKKVMFLNDVLPDFLWIKTLKEQISFESIVRRSNNIVNATGTKDYLEKEDLEKYFK